MNFSRKEIEKTNRNDLLKELKDISMLEFPGDITKQNARKIIMWLRFQDGKITQEEYEIYWSITRVLMWVQLQNGKITREQYDDSY